MSSVKEINDDTFNDEVINYSGAVLVEFSADWCGPCQRQLPILEKFAEENPDRVKVCKVDVDECPQTVAKFAIRGVPSILLFHQGEKLGMKVGLTTTAALDNLLLEKVGK